MMRREHVFRQGRRIALATAFAASLGASVGALAQVGAVGNAAPTPPYVVRGTHQFLSGGVPPTFAGCGSGAILGNSSIDNFGDVITGTSPGAACVITFAVPFSPIPPNCTVSGETGPTSYSRSMTALTLTGVQASTRYTWQCVGRLN